MMKKVYEEPSMEITRFYVEEKIMSITPGEGEISPYAANPVASWVALDENN